MFRFVETTRRCMIPRGSTVCTVAWRCLVTLVPSTRFPFIAKMPSLALGEVLRSDEYMVNGVVYCGIVCASLFPLERLRCRRHTYWHPGRIPRLGGVLESWSLGCHQKKVLNLSHAFQIDDENGAGT